jgi:hypothetical protein
MADAIDRQRIGDGVDAAGSEPTVPARRRPFTPSGLVGVSTGLSSICDGAEIIGARHGVVHERAGQHLPALPIVLHQHSAEPLRDAAHNPAVPASPAPLTPSGLAGVGTGLSSIATSQKSSVRGVA